MTDSTLFPELHGPAADLPQEGPFARVAIEGRIDKELDYRIPKALMGSLHVGQRVKVPLGRKNKPTTGLVVGIEPTASTTATIKSLYAIDDDRILLTAPLIRLAKWISRYYCAPLGAVVESMIPAAVKKKVGLEYTVMVQLAKDRPQIQALLEKTRAPKRRAILARLLLMEPGESAELQRLATAAGTTQPTIRKLAKLGLITIASVPNYQFVPGTGQPATPAAAGLRLNEDQQPVFDDLAARLDAGFSVNLLYGVTGSGKTEVYLQCIRRVVESGRRAIVLVPEIALTPQTVRRFTERFARVAILHSGMAAGQRHRYWQQIAQGQADVVVGARSAIFAPVPDLGIIVVDEEHESSYKADTAPRYHARDVAIKRGQIEDVPVILGSATPSLESWYRAKMGASGEARGTTADKNVGPTEAEATADKNVRLTEEAVDVALAQSKIENRKSKIPYRLLSLSRRVRGLAMPEVELVDMRRESRIRPRGIHLMSHRLEALLHQTLRDGHQAMLLLNRRGYSSFVYCSSCTHVVQCKYCDATMTYHRSAGTDAHSAALAAGLHTGQLHCHYCLAVNSLPDKCPECGKKLSLFGLGTQRVEEELVRKFPGVTFARVDSDSMHNARDYEATLGAFARGETKVLLGTQMIAKGLDYPNVTLVGVISADTALSLPDFRAAERTLQLITQVAGRAGRGNAPGRVVVQTFTADAPAIQMAIRQDYLSFASAELKQRREVRLPPITRMVRIVVRDQDLDKLQQTLQKLVAELAPAVAAEAVTLKGPMPCAINRIAGYHRAQILLFAPTPQPLQRALAAVRSEGGFASSDRIAVDVDPVSLL